MILRIALIVPNQIIDESIIEQQQQQQNQALEQILQKKSDNSLKKTKTNVSIKSIHSLVSNSPVKRVSVLHKRKR